MPWEPLGEWGLSNIGDSFQTLYNKCLANIVIINW
jgi:hypothetical protein